jgi:phosphofructokinase-like protein
MKKLLVLTGGGDCPGLNAVIRGITKAAHHNGDWEVWGSVEAFNGLLKSPIELIELTKEKVAGIHVKGGTILKTTNRGNPLEYPIQLADGSWSIQDKTQELVDIIKANGFDAVVNIGGDGSQKISQVLFENGLNILGVPKTIDNDLSATDLTFGFSTAVQIATECFDKLVTTAESHHRIMIMEVMGRDAGWISLYTAIAGGAEICLIPEIPFDLEVIIKKIESRYDHGKGFVNIVVAEGAKVKKGKAIENAATVLGDKHLKLGGIAIHLRAMLEEANCSPQIRTTVLGHIQRGGTPISFDRILASSMGVKAFEMARDGEFGKMVAYKNNQLEMVSILEAVKDYNFVKNDHYLINTARSLGVSFGDEQ